MLRYVKPVPGNSKGPKQAGQAALKPEGRRLKSELLAEGHQPKTENRIKIHEHDVVGRLNPDTGEVIEYPFPHSEISMREFFLVT